MLASGSTISLISLSTFAAILPDLIAEGLGLATKVTPYTRTISDTLKRFHIRYTTSLSRRVETMAPSGPTKTLCSN
jgi:hypothetical protein